MTKFNETYWAELAAKEKAESEAQVVANVMGRIVTRGELSKAFDAVANKANWKLPINASVDLDEFTKAMVAEAVVFFTGSKAKFKRLTGTTTGGIGRYRVTAAGYYAAIGA
jgi:hypothetical protein